MRWRAVILLLVLNPGMVRADSARAPALKTGPAAPIQAYARQNPHCAEWTDGCTVCVNRDGQALCSTPGIACTPAGLTCKRPIKQGF